MRSSIQASNEPTRRDFMEKAASVLLGVSVIAQGLPGQVHAEGVKGGTAKRIIYLYMDGGMSHVDTWDPKNGEVAGPTKTIPSSADGIMLGEYLPRTAKQMHHGTVVRSLSSTQGAHEQGKYFMHTSYQLLGTISHPSMGAWLSHFQGPGNPTLPASAYIGNASRHPGAGFFPPAHAPLFINNPEKGLRDIELRKGLTSERHRALMALTGSLDAGFMEAHGTQRSVREHTDAYDGAYKMMGSKDLIAFDLTREKPELRESYGMDSFGQGCLLARRLIETGVRCAEVSLHGWDTHKGNFTVTPDLCEKLDKGLSALLQDLHDRGLLKDTLVVVATEFGRTPRINISLGRDHYPKAFSAALFGGGVKGGAVYGATNETGEEVAEKRISIPDFNASIAYALGLPIEQTVMSPSKRPFKIADKGMPVPALFA
jgi:hypothetical protein